MNFRFLQSQRQGFESCQEIASDKSNLLRKVELLPKNDIQVKLFFIPLETG